MKNKFLGVFIILAGLSTAGLAFADCDTTQIKASYLGQRGASVRNVQDCLIKAGYTIPAGPTGYYGAQTLTALKLFYKDTLNMVWHGRNFGPQGISALKGIFSGQSIFVPSQTGIKKVHTQAELKNYITKAQAVGTYGFGAVAREAVGTAAPAMDMAKSAESTQSAPSAGRVSETTVQVKGIDEPDIVKTDGTNIYFSTQGYYYIGGPIRAMSSGIAESKAILPTDWNPSKTRIIKAFPAETLGVATSSIKETGEMLLVKDKKILVIFSYPEIVGYDISNSQNPQKKWSYKIEDNTSIMNSRLLGGQIYFVTRQNLDYSNPCLVKPLSRNGSFPIIPCDNIYRPINVMPVDVTYTAFVLDPVTGNIGKNVSFLGSVNHSVLYMSPENLYIAFYQPESYAKVYSSFISQKGSEIYPADVVQKIKNVAGLDIGDNAKNVEIQEILNKHLNSLNKDERLRVSNEAANKLSDFVKANKRNLEKTSIVKIGLTNLAVAGSGTVPGNLLNQFALDEYNGYLRTAVTVGTQFFGFSTESANDVYVLDRNMQIMGKVQDLGISERIYSSRFIGDKGYLVTFRQIDPFYVLDLSNPSNPKMTGELKIPGFSSFLEPLGTDRILGVGREGGKVKVSLFDVSDPSKPTEKAKYNLEEYWTEVENNHKAFLLDSKHSVFFLPGGNGGYVFSYKDDNLSLAKAVGDYAVKRAVYLDDNLYIIGENKITALNELNWEKIKEIDLN